MISRNDVRTRARRTAVLGAAAATATALTVTAAAPAPPIHPPVLRPVVGHSIDLTAASYTSVFPKPGAWHDITGGLGNAVYHAGQNIIDTVLPAIVNAINLEAIGQSTGLNLTGIINQIPKTLLPQILDALPLKLAPLLQQSLGLVGDALVPLLQALGIMDAGGNVTLTKLLSLVGVDIDNLFNLGGLSVPGVKVVTAGPVFTLLKLIGIDLGWTPGTADAVAKAVDATPYLNVGVAGLIDTVLDKADDALGILNPLVTALRTVIDGLDLSKLDLIGVRIPLTIGFGLGAFSLGQAYNQIVADLAHGPDGADNPGANILGGLTIMPEILLNNLGRANGGLLARFYPIGDLLGINTVTPDAEAVHSGSGLDVLGTGISLGAANLLPIKVDATLEYQPFSDFAAWPNPFSLFNNLIAGTEPSYLLRGISTDTLSNQLGEALGGVTDSILAGDPLAANIYLTIPTATLPLLEPLYLTGDVLNMVTFGTVGRLFTRLANALAPAMSSLVNLGYTDVVRSADGTYTRTLDQADQAVPFFSLPNINWAKVPGDILHDLQVGFQKEFFSNNPTAAPPNVVDAVVSLLTGGRISLGNNPLAGPLAALTKAVSTAVSALVNTVTRTLRGLTGQGAAAGPAAVPATRGTLIALPVISAAVVKDSPAKATRDGDQAKEDRTAGKHAAAQDGADVPARSTAKAERHAGSSDADADADADSVKVKGDKELGGQKVDKTTGRHGAVSVGRSGGSTGTGRHSADSSAKAHGGKDNSNKHHRTSAGRHAA